MKRNTDLCVDLKTVMHSEVVLKQGKSYTGILTRDAESHYLFEETLRKMRTNGNPKLFDGHYVSMVKQKNGRYQCHLKGFDPGKVENRHELAVSVCNELLEAFSILG